MQPTRPEDRLKDNAEVDLVLMATADLHLHILPYDYFRDAPAEGGLMALAGRIEAMRALHPNTLLFDNGDFLQGTPVEDLALAEAHAAGWIHPMIAAMNALDYDAATLGNHEFNFGLPFLERALAGARFPLVLANVIRAAGTDPCRDTPYLPPVALIERQFAAGDGRPVPLRIGVIGLVTSLVAVWDREHLAGRVEVRDVVDTARAWGRHLRDRGADLVVALHHAGIGSAVWTPGQEDAAIPLGRSGAVDVQVLGHSHAGFPDAALPASAGVDPVASRVGGIPAVLPAAFGAELGVIHLRLARAEGGWRIAGSRAERLRPEPAAAPATPRARAVAAAVAADHDRTLARIRAAVGWLEAPLDSHFALVAPDATLALTAEAQRAHVAAALAGGPHGDLPVLSAVAPYAAGGRAGPGNFIAIPEGPLRLRHIAEILPYPNEIRAVEVTGAELALWLERSAAQFLTVAPGTEAAPLIDPEAAGYAFDVIFGLDYTIDLSQPRRFSPAGASLDPAARRIGAIRHGGRAVAPLDRFILATNSYRLNGGGSFPALGRPQSLLPAGDASRGALLRHVERLGRIRPVRQPVWSFAPLPGARAWFRTAPEAAGTLARADAPGNITAAGLDPEGFLRCLIDLGATAAAAGLAESAGHP